MGIFFAVGPLVIGFLLDLWLGDPWPVHPVRWMGALIAGLEGPLRQALPATKKGELAAGALLAALTAGLGGGVCLLLLRVAAEVHPWLWFALECILSYQFLAAGSLRDESMLVYTKLQDASIEAARAALSRIVGRDTGDLGRQDVVRAAVETVAENTCDGVIAPMLYLALFGAAGGAVYKTVNTLDSMVGYKNERYRYFGRAGARLDDLCGWIPARLSGLLLCPAAALCGLDALRAFAVWRRDRRRHSSPNSAQSESACAGALGICLGGPASYGGVRVDKPAIGDDTRPPQAEDIIRANRMMLAAAAIALPLCCAGRILLWRAAGL